MTDLEDVNGRLEALKTSAAADIHKHYAPALRRFRFIPRAERQVCADAFADWARYGAASAPVKRGYALLLQAMDRFINEENEASLGLLMETRKVFAEHREADGLGLTDMLIGALYRTLGNYDLALPVLVEGFELLRASGRYPIFLAATANSMANIDLELGHLDEAISMFQVTLDESTRADDFYFRIYGLHGLGRVYLMQGNRDAAATKLREALDVAERSGHPLQISNSLTELASLHFATDDLAETEALSARALAMREQHHLLGGAITNCVRLAEIYLRRSQWDEALAILTRALAIADELKVKPKLAQVHQMLADLYERSGDHAKSLVHFKRFHALREQVEREDSARKLSDARIVFEAEQTKRENAVIREQKAEIERKNIQLQNTIDELTRAKIGRRARATTLGLVVILFVFQDLLLGSALSAVHSNNYFVLLAVKMGIIFSLAPVNRAIEGYLLRRVATTSLPRA